MEIVLSIEADQSYLRMIEPESPSIGNPIIDRPHLHIEEAVQTAYSSLERSAKAHR